MSSIKIILRHMMELVDNSVLILMLFPARHTLLPNRRQIVSQNLPRSLNHLINQVVFISFKVFPFSLFKISFNSNSLYSIKVVVLDWTWTLSVSLLSVLFIWRATSSWNVTPSWINCFNLLRRSTPLISLSLVLLVRNST